MRIDRRSILILPALATLLIFALFYKTSPSGIKQTIFSLTSDFDRTVQLITRIRSNYPSVNGLRYRSLVCTMVRNDPHIVEFLLRHLISGFSHIVVYDNNRIVAGYDLNMTDVLAPFIAAGVVTHVPIHQNWSGSYFDELKNWRNRECLRQYGMNADWLGIFDTDEYFYYETQNSSVNTLNDLLLTLEQQSYCGITILWTMMYGEGKMLRQNTTLFESYPRIYQTIAQHKVLARPQLTHFHIPHYAKCNSTNYTMKTWESDNSSRIGLIHYHSKSMEEFLTKIDQTMVPYVIKAVDIYRTAESPCLRINFSYSDDYRRTFLNAHNQFNILHGSEPKKLLSPPLLNIQDIPVRSDIDYALYMYLKYRCLKREEFDHEKYLAINPDVKQAIKNGTMVDSFQHFLFNFAKGAIGCWKTDTYAICE